MVFAKLNLKIKYLSLYERLNWDFKNVDIPSINHGIDVFEWGNSFEGINVHEQVHFFNKTILNIFRTISLTKQLLLMIKIHCGLTMKLDN